MFRRIVSQRLNSVQANNSMLTSAMHIRNNCTASSQGRNSLKGKTAIVTASTDG